MVLEDPGQPAGDIGTRRIGAGRGSDDEMRQPATLRL
jgi:hypothetical protein